MKPYQVLIAASLALIAAQSDAQTFSSTSAPSNSYFAPSYTTPDSSLAFTIVPGQWGNGSFTPGGDKGSYLAIEQGGSATVPLYGATSFSFLWGSPDANNTITIDGTTYTGSEIYTGGTWVTFSSPTGMQDITFSQPSGCCFEVAVSADSYGAAAISPTPDPTAVTPVPEPSTGALLLGGLGGIGAIVRRRAAQGARLSGVLEA